MAVRLTDEEITRLRNLAAKQGLGPSTFARIVLASTIERQNYSRIMTLEQLKNGLETLFAGPMKDKVEDIVGKSGIGNPPLILFVDVSQEKEYEDFLLLFSKALLASVGIKVIVPEKESYQKLKEIAEETVSKEEIKI